MSKTFLLSRNYVEFGPFAGSEILDLHHRGIVREQDYILAIESETWLTVPEWLASVPKAAPKAAPKARKAASGAKKTAAPRRKAA